MFAQKYHNKIRTVTIDMYPTDPAAVLERVTAAYQLLLEVDRDRADLVSAARGGEEAVQGDVSQLRDAELWSGRHRHVHSAAES